MQNSESLICKICGNKEGNIVYEFKEMLFGWRDEFEYFQCSACSCLQKSDTLCDLSKYYPDEYCSFQADLRLERKEDEPFWIRYLKQKRKLYYLEKKGIIGRIVSLMKPVKEPIPEYATLLKKCKADFDSKILDVGCAKGDLLYSLSKEGFKYILGVDPFIEKDIVFDTGAKVLRQKLCDTRGKFDILIFNHSLEHMPEQALVFKDIVRLLDNEGCAIIRTPTVSSYAWRHYGPNWFQIDAPRHLFIHSLESLKILTKEAGLKTKEIIFDSTGIQFWASQQYSRGIPLLDARSYLLDHNAGIFDEKEIRSFESKAAELNKKSEGDQICVYLTKI